MSDVLHEQQCEVCQIGAPNASEKEVAVFMRDLVHWKIIEVNGIKMVQREFKFDSFKAALAFTNKVAELAESLGHHPEIITEWGKTTVTWWTHKINGVHKSDFVMAAKTDLLFT